MPAVLVLNLILIAYGIPAAAGPVQHDARAATTCPADTCFCSVRLIPAVASIASKFCSSYIRYTPTVTTSTLSVTTSTSISTSTISVTPAPVTAFQTNSVTPPVAQVTSSCVTVTALTTTTFSTSVAYPTRASRAGGNNNKRAIAAVSTTSSSSRTTSSSAQLATSVSAAVSTFSAALASSCGSGNALTSKISSACSCYLGSTKTVTQTSLSTAKASTVTTTSTTLTASTTTQTLSVTISQSTSTQCLTATTTSTVLAGGGVRTCGVPIVAYTTGGTITCPTTTTSGTEPSATMGRFRIEGNDNEGTLFDGCIASGPREITTPSGGTHLCDGTNDGAHSTPGGTGTTQIDAAGDLNGFDFDGTYSTTYSDFFIQRIGASSQTGNEYWGILRDYQYTSAGGCQEYSSPGQVLWAFNAFNKNAFLSLSSEYAVVTPGATVSLIVSDGMSGSTFAGANFAGATSGSDGSVTFTAPMAEGCYQYKATGSGALRSPAFYLGVVNSL